MSVHGLSRQVRGNTSLIEDLTLKEEQASELVNLVLSSAYYSGQRIDKYKLLDDSYRASGGFETGEYLIPHPRENSNKYLRRKNMSYYINYVRPIVDALINPIFRNDPKRFGTSSIYDLFLKDVDGNGTSLTRFMKKAAVRAKLHGVEFIVMDMARINNNEIVTEKDIISRRLYPYLYLISPDKVIDYSLDKFGRLQMIRYSVNISSVNDDGEVTEEVETWLWTEKFCKRTINSDTERFDNPIGIIPVVPVYGAVNNSDDLIIDSEMLSIARTNFALYNACSELRERNRAQAFSILTYPVDADDDYESSEVSIKVGTSDMLLYRNGSQMPEFITPPPDSSDIIENEIKLLVDEIYRMANLRLMTINNSYNVSGTAREWDSLQLFQSISDIAQGLQEAEYRIAKMFSRFMSDNLDNISVVYNTQYGVTDSTAILTNATQALSLNISGEYNKEIKRQVIRATLKDLDSSSIESIVKDFEIQEKAGDGIDGNVKTVQPVTV